MASEREEAYAEWAQHMENVQRAHPETDAKLSTEWWKPAVDFPIDIKQRFGVEVYTKMNVLLQKIYTGNMTPEDREKTMQEARECLKDDPDLLKRFDDILEAVGPGFWDVMEMIKSNSNASASSDQ